MLIIRSGKYKNKRLKEVDPSITRPSKDIVKLGLFNIIGKRIIDSSFLDLYGGSGQIGLEALSKGAKKVIINDSSLKAYKVILENRDITLKSKVSDNLDDFNKISITNLKDIDFIKKYENNLFDIIFLDPPYLYNNEKEILSLLYKYELANENSLIFIEKDSELDISLANDYNIKKYKYGRSLLFLLSLKKDDNSKDIRKID